MDYLKDWDKSKERLKAFWNREIIDRCCFSVRAPLRGKSNKMEPMPEKYEDRIKYWTDGEWVLRRNKTYFENTFFGGDATPQIFLNFGAAGHAGFFKNAKFQFEETIWFFPIINDWDRDILEFDPQSLLYTKMINMANYLVNESKGSFLVSMPDNAGNIDALAHLRGSDNLLFDLIDEEENVHKALNKIQKTWLTTNNQIFDIVRDNNDGGSSIAWLNTWAPGKHAQMQADMSVMISPRDYEKFILPELKEQVESMDNSLYHLDGQEQVRHLDLILSIDRLKAIQWTCVEGQPSPLNFIPELRKIQEAGKCLVIMTSPREAEGLLEQLSSKGLYLVLRVDSEEEACDFSNKVEKLTHE